MAVKRQAESSSARPAKKTRTDDEPRATTSQPKQIFTSALVADEADFPRGGGTGLKPIEYKEVREEARKEADAEFEAERKAKRATQGGKGKGKDGKRGKPEKKEVDDKDQIRVEHLSYKRLLPGTKLLARVHSVLNLHLILSLPNQLLAHVPITEISPSLTALLHASNDSDDEDEDMEKEDESEAPELNELFTPGQYVSCVLTEVYATATSNPTFTSLYPPTETIRLSGRLEASLYPEKVNEGVGRLDISKGYKMQVAIKAEEDHGWVVDIGVKGLDGFLTKKNAGAKPLVIGQIVDAMVDADLPTDARMAQLTLDRTTVNRAILSEASTVSSVLPGHLVMALITAVVPSGLNVRICGFFDGTIDLTHLGLGKEDVEAKFKVGKKIKARVVNDNLAHTPKRFGLSVLEHVVNLESPKSVKGKSLETEFGIGKVLEEVEVVRVDKEFGLVALTKEGYPAYVHINHLADERPATLSGSSGNYRVGTKHSGRVIGHSPFDGTILLSFAPKVLAQRFMLVNEVQVGEIMKGTITKLSDKALFVNISGAVDGVAWPHHYADIQLKHPEKRFRPGGSVKCRVFAIEPEKNRIKLTLKKSLVESKHEIPKSFADVKVGMITSGVVTKVFDKGCLVELFGGSSAFISSVEASDSFIKNMNDVVFSGKPINLRIIAVDEANQRITGSIRQASSSFAERQALAVGDSVEGTVAEIHTDQIALTLQPSEARALLSLSKLAHTRNVKIADLRKSLTVGEKMTDLEVVAKNEATGLIIVVSKKKEVAAGEVTSISLPQSLHLGSLKPGQIVPARIASRDANGYWVKVTKAIRGRVALTDICDDFSQVPEDLPAHSVVSCCVLHVDEKAKRLDLSMRPSRVNMAGSSSSTIIVDPEIEGVTSLKTGQKVRGFVKNVTSSGVYLTLGRNLSARIMIRELFDDYVADWQKKFTVGQLLEGKILNVDLKNERVEVTLKKKASGAEKKKKAAVGLADFAVDQKVEAIVKKVEPYGMFLRIDNTSISGLCHRSEISDDPKADIVAALKTFREGDHVRAKITAIDTEKNKLSLGIKPSYFEEADFNNGEVVKIDDDEEEEEEVANEGMDVDLREIDTPSTGQSEASEQGEEEEDEEMSDGAGDESEDMIAVGSDDDEEEEEEEVVWPTEFEAKEPSSSAAASAQIPTEPLSTVFNWDGAAAGAEEESDSDSESEEEEAPQEAAKSKKRKSNAPYQDLTAEVHTKTPESTSEFERALLASPNSSLLWIQYMAFQMELSEIGKARDIGRRALDKIAFREEGEKLNVWMALLNLENAHGTPESLEKLFKEAAQYNDAKTVFLRTASILQESEKYEAAEDMYKRAAKKFGYAPDLWAKYAEYHFSRDQFDAARALLPRSLKSLPKAEHTKIIERFAMLEFKMGEPERGKTIYEGLVDKFPKLMYLWNNYVDQVAKQGDIQSVRGLIDRALDQKLKDRNAKFLFKKLLAVETRIGDEAGQEMAKAKARAWVAKNHAEKGIAAVEEESEEEEEEEGEDDEEEESDEE